MFRLELDSVSGGSAVFTALPHHQQSVSRSVGVEAGRDRVLVVPGSGTILSVLAFLLFAKFETASPCFDDRAVQ